MKSLNTPQVLLSIASPGQVSTPSGIKTSKNKYTLGGHSKELINFFLRLGKSLQKTLESERYRAKGFNPKQSRYSSSSSRLLIEKCFERERATDSSRTELSSRRVRRHLSDSAMDPLLHNGMNILLRWPPTFALEITASACNFKASGTSIIQVSFHEQYFSIMAQYSQVVGGRKMVGSLPHPPPLT